ncbi:hypothetical protein [Chondromyces apiculatus]|uniref:hypothetical protein n=1 Tax=Chondromyces apiculatus TaxID=51 RepID=UPI0012DF21EC|nr:hypothetical protein [Chondromyces apiculatus]
MTRFTRTEEDVDALMAMARSIDYAAWERDNEAWLRRRGPSADLRAVMKRLRALREATEKGDLFERLQDVAAQVKKTYRAERARRMKVAAERRSRPAAPR